jgi:hypothetical protein
MINTVENSQAKKTRGIAVTYRAGGGDMFATCPDSCALKPSSTSTHDIDRDYESAVRRAVPTKGIAFLFTHFDPIQWAEQNTGAPDQTVFNYSADTLADAACNVAKGVATVTVVPHDYWNDKASDKVTESDGIRFVRCHNESNPSIDCRNCGNGSPLCARSERDYGIAFTSHGPGKRKASNPDESGGCYGGFGNVAIHWRNVARREQIESDSDKVTRFAKSLAPHSILRHHVVGDIGRVPVALK